MKNLTLLSCILLLCIGCDSRAIKIERQTALESKDAIRELTGHRWTIEEVWGDDVYVVSMDGPTATKVRLKIPIGNPPLKIGNTYVFGLVDDRVFARQQ
jgi:uncharacterized protein YcfL